MSANKRSYFSSNSSAENYSLEDILLVRKLRKKLKEYQQQNNLFHLQVLVDTREREQDILWQCLSDLPFVYRTALPAADIWILVNGRIFLAIERKAFSDLVSSIQGERMATQKANLYQLPVDEPWRLCYLLEGEAPVTSVQISKDKLGGVLTGKDDSVLSQTEIPKQNKYKKSKLTITSSVHSEAKTEEKEHGEQKEVPSSTKHSLLHEEFLGSLADVCVRDCMTTIRTKDAVQSVAYTLKLLMKLIAEWEVAVKLVITQGSAFDNLQQPPAQEIVDSANTCHANYQTMQDSSTKQGKRIARKLNNTLWLTHSQRRFVDAFQQLKEKKELLENPRVNYVMFLMWMQRMSLDKAEAIAKKFPTLKSLMDFIHDDSMSKKQRIKTLSDIEAVNTSARNADGSLKLAHESKPRRIGRLGELLFELYYNTEEEQEEDKDKSK